jgi:hypothetical protein
LQEEVEKGRQLEGEVGRLQESLERHVEEGKCLSVVEGVVQW